MAAPQCDLTQNIPPADPQAAKGFQVIPNGASMAQLIRIVNNNFFRLAPVDTFTNFAGQQGPGGRQGQAGKAGKNAKEGNWNQKDIVTQKVRVYHIDANGAVDKSQFIDFVRVNKLTMSDVKTGATWVYTRKGVDGPNIEILQQG
jgi:hypothetical protein